MSSTFPVGINNRKFDFSSSVYIRFVCRGIATFDLMVGQKIFIWNYFVAKNIREKNFHGFPVSTKIF